MDEIEELKKKVEEKQSQEIDIFKPKEQPIAEVKEPDKNQQLVEGMFNQAILHEVANNEELKENVLDAAKVYVDTEMQTIKTKVDTKNKEAVFDNNKDACESYGFNEKTTPKWAIGFMRWGYNVILAIWLFVGSFTFMPVIFVAKKISVGIKKTWLAGLIALLIYLGVTLTPIIMAIIR